MSKLDAALLIWLGVTNLAAFAAFGVDKWRAAHAGRRISEATLVICGATGGCLGGWLGMKLFRHKTIKWTFQLKYALGLIPMSAGLWAWWHFR